MKTSNRRKVVSLVHDSGMYTLTLECGHTTHVRGRSHAPPKTGICPRCPNTCGAVPAGRTLECQMSPGHALSKGRNSRHEDSAGYRWSDAVKLGELGPVLGDS